MSEEKCLKLASASTGASLLFTFRVPETKFCTKK